MQASRQPSSNSAVTWLPSGDRGGPNLVWAPESRCPRGYGVVAYSTDAKPEFAYEPFNAGRDFGPIDIGRTVVYCRWVDALRENHADCNTLVHLTADNPKETWTNTVTLCAAYLVLAQGFSAEEAFGPFVGFTDFLPLFVDCRGESAAGSGINDDGEQEFKLSILDVLLGIERARDLRWVDYRTFAAEEHSSMLRPEHGDMSWLIPGQALAMASPWAEPFDLDALPVCMPENLAPYFLENNVRLVVQCNSPALEEGEERRRKISYDPQSFERVGIRHLNIPFEDGGCPSIDILQRFLQTVEAHGTGFAVHCRSGLGRTATMIGTLALRYYGFSARSFIGWCRVMRPGTVHGSQQQYLVNLEMYLKPGASRQLESLSQRERLQLLPRRELRFWALDSGIRAETTCDRSESEIIELILQARGWLQVNAPSGTSASSALRAPDPAAAMHRVAAPLSISAASLGVEAVISSTSLRERPQLASSTRPPEDTPRVRPNALQVDDWEEALRYLRLLTAVQADGSSSWNTVIRSVEQLRELSKAGKAMAPTTLLQADRAQAQELQKMRASRQAKAEEALRWDAELQEAMQKARHAERECDQLKFRIVLEREARLAEASRCEQNGQAWTNEAEGDDERMKIAEQKVRGLRLRLQERQRHHASGAELQILRARLREAQDMVSRKSTACRLEQMGLEAARRQLDRLRGTTSEQPAGLGHDGKNQDSTNHPLNAWQNAKRSVERLRDRLLVETVTANDP